MKPAATEFAWALTDHVCGECLGRVLARRIEGADRLGFRCSNCGAEGEGRQGLAHPPICACGLRLFGGRNAGIRCVANGHVTIEVPSEIVAREQG